MDDVNKLVAAHLAAAAIRSAGTTNQGDCVQIYKDALALLEEPESKQTLWR